MKRFIKSQWLSLNGRLKLCLIAAIIGMTLSAFMALQSSWQDSRNEAYEEFSVTSATLLEEFTQQFDAYENAAQMVGYFTSSQQFLLSEDPETVIRAYSPALSYLDSVMQLSPGCVNIYLYSHNGRQLYANSTRVSEFRALLKARGFDSDIRVSSPFFARLPGDMESSYLLYCVPIFSTSPPYTSNRIIAGVLCDMSALTRYAAAIEGEGQAATALLYGGSIISSTRELDENELDMLPEIPQGHGSVSRRGGRYLTTRVSMPERHWEFIHFVPEKEIISKLFHSLTPWLIPIFAMVLLMSLLLIFLLQSVNKSIGQITMDLNCLAWEQGLTEHIHEPPLVELQLIARSANRMLDRIDQSFRQEQETQAKLYQAINAQSQAEFMGYRNQINPHFLFNTLECMRSMAHSRGERELETLVSAMALTFRYSLYSDSMTRLAQELNHVQSYFQVVNIRFPGRYSLKISAAPETLEHATLSMVLQPIVENAISHAFSSRESGCRVAIQARRQENGFLLLRVADNGQGMSPEELRQLDRQMRHGDSEPQGGRSSIGLHNIYQRMKLTFGSHFHIRFHSREGFYTVVELVIPPSPQVPPFQT
ncbi:sensor histidine kinase [Acutalibacter muris]|uniref:sensor histidine kinase n=1 Tax=Acutalibacter muris TaxID=1796620 RepID=UPI00272DE371|nr:sensor histidine kinase [Acutalibacter muris]